jgi:DNA-binding NarL/FixJ family response regulator
VRIFIASKDSTFRIALQLLLESEPGMVVIGISDRAEGLLTILGASRPDVILLDDELTQQTTIQIISDIQRLECQCKIIILSVDPDLKKPTLKAGADGFINKNYPPDKLLPILRDMKLSASAV